jgi:UDP-N-acetylglucosamine 4,6-dehydratase
MIIKNSTILVTGGTGSFGQRFIEILLKNYKPKKIIIYSRDELKQSLMQEKYKDKRLRFFLGDVRDLQRLKLATRGVDILIHAAALKQVPAAEYNPTECIQTNINGAKNVISACIENKLKKIIALSTDKAVSPINLYGATKLVSDKLFIAANNIVGNQKISFSVVRYGNVINSRGSVIPFFNKLANDKKSNYIPITHKDTTRFLISLDDGVNFVIESLKIMKGGEVFIPLCESIRIVDLANKIAPTKKLKFVGLRPGEKVHEILYSNDEIQNVLKFKKYFIIIPSTNIKSNYMKNALGEIGKKLKNKLNYSSKDYIKISKLKKDYLNLLNIS